MNVLLKKSYNDIKEDFITDCNVKTVSRLDFEEPMTKRLINETKDDAISNVFKAFIANDDKKITEIFESFSFLQAIKFMKLLYLIKSQSHINVILDFLSKDTTFKEIVEKAGRQYEYFNLLFSGKMKFENIYFGYFDY